MTYDDKELEIKLPQDIKVRIPISKLTNPDKIQGGATVHLDYVNNVITIVENVQVINPDDEIFNILKDF